MQEAARPGTVFIFDDTLEVPVEIAAVAGVASFGQLLHDRRRLRDRALSTARRVGFSECLCLSDRAGMLALHEAAAEAPPLRRYIIQSSDIVGIDEALLGRFLATISYAEADLVAIPAGSGRGSAISALGPVSLRRLLACRTRSERHAFYADRSERIERLEVPRGILGIASPGPFTRFVSGSFYTRAFNAMRDDGRTVQKRSQDVDKLRREHAWWYLLPPRLQRMVVQPYDLQIGDGWASYRMERLNIPDMAVVWVHGPGALSEAELEDFLDAVFDWFEQRPTRPVPPEEARAAARSLYVDKLDRRIARLLALEGGQRLDARLQVGTEGGLRGLVQRYRQLLHAEWREGIGQELAVLHGDLCFSNILFDKRSRLLRLIDPRGAESDSELYGDPYYDIAKLSHSVLGGYDFLNHGLFDVVIGEGLGLELRSQQPAPGPREERFLRRVQEAGFDPRRMRLYEASLFLSMLPLHAEDPRKLLAFALTAERILDQVEAWESPQASWLARVLG